MNILDYIIPRLYAQINYDGTITVDLIENIPCYFADCQYGYAETYKIKHVWMTRHQYKSLPEFTGF